MDSSVSEHPRFLSKGLAGDDAFQNAEIASVGDAISDLVADVYKPFIEKDESKKVTLAVMH